MNANNGEAALRAQLTAETGRVHWSDLRAHSLRQSLFLVSAPLKLLDAAVGIAADDSASVGAWLEDGTLSRPSGTQLQAWQELHDKAFESVVVQPFVIAREL